MKETHPDALLLSRVRDHVNALLPGRWEESVLVGAERDKWLVLLGHITEKMKEEKHGAWGWGMFAFEYLSAHMNEVLTPRKTECIDLVMKVCIDNGADVNTIALLHGEFRMSLLMGATCCEHEGAVEALLKAGADPNVPDGAGDMPLHMSAFSASLELGANPLIAKEGVNRVLRITALLIDAGANETAKDHEGLTILERVKQNSTGFGPTAKFSILMKDAIESMIERRELQKWQHELNACEAGALKVARVRI